MPPERLSLHARNHRESLAGVLGEAFPATRRQVGAGYFDDVMTTLSGGTASTLALAGSTEQAQF